MSQDHHQRVYPTIALSDVITSCAFSYASYVLFQRGDPLGATGFAFVACAAVAGILRWGFFPRQMQSANELASFFAGCVGLPLAGFLPTLNLLQLNRFPVEAVGGPSTSSAYASFEAQYILLIIGSICILTVFLHSLVKKVSRGVLSSETIAECVTFFMTFCFFVLPNACVGASSRFTSPKVGALLSFAAGGLCFAEGRGMLYDTLWGVLRVNLFHGFIALGAVLYVL